MGRTGDDVGEGEGFEGRTAGGKEAVQIVDRTVGPVMDAPDQLSDGGVARAGACLQAQFAEMRHLRKAVVMNVGSCSSHSDQPRSRPPHQPTEVSATDQPPSIPPAEQPQPHRRLRRSKKPATHPTRRHPRHTLPAAVSPRARSPAIPSRLATLATTRLPRLSRGWCRHTGKSCRGGRLGRTGKSSRLHP